MQSDMKTTNLRSYAKINLTLDVSRRRPDGYHDIDSVAQVIDLYDELEVSRADDGDISIRVDGGEAPADRTNLVCRAAEVFFTHTGVGGGARFVLRKQIPARAGLGGGSGNAAAALAGLNRLYECGLSRGDVCALASRVGSDAALFVVGGTVRMRGRGEIVEPLPDAPRLELVVIKPPVGVSTAWAYAELDKRERLSTGASDAAEAAVRAGDRAALIACLSNDFDPVMCALVPEIESAKRALLDVGALAAMLCGSGSAVFGVFGSQDAANQAASALSGAYPCVFVCRTLIRSESRLM